MNENTRQDMLHYPASRIVDVAKALSGDVRVRILEVLADKPMSVGQLADALGVAQPTVSINVQMLEQAGLVASAQGANREKICSVTGRSVLLELPAKPGDGLHQTEELHMPIGMYAHCSVQPPCGMAGRDGSVIGSADDPRVFYMPDRVEAALLWFSGAGYVEYLFANPLPPNAPPDELVIRAELCSEAPSFREDWLSDISLSVNGKPAGTWTSPSDFGNRKGRLTPERWKSGTEYGMLTEWRITREGCSINGSRSADVSIAELGLAFHEPIRVRFEVRSDSPRARGLNLFGAGFGDHPQDIVLSFVRYTQQAE